MPTDPASLYEQGLLPQIKPIQVHHLVPLRNEGTDELPLRIRTSIDFGIVEICVDSSNEWLGYWAAFSSR
jgi:hypothetical protein